MSFANENFFKTYEFIKFHMKKNDKKFTIVSITGVIDYPNNFEDSKFEETAYYLNVESWDILSNNTVKTIRVNVNQNLNEIFNVYNFPNPFHDKTFFTFHMKNPEPIDIKITIYSKTGKQITTLQESINEIKSYHVFPESGWDGTDRYSSQLKNGTYFYHLNIKTINGNVLHDKVHKITILK